MNKTDYIKSVRIRAAEKEKGKPQPEVKFYDINTGFERYTYHTRSNIFTAEDFAVKIRPQKVTDVLNGLCVQQSKKELPKPAPIVSKPQKPVRQFTDFKTRVEEKVNLYRIHSHINGRSKKDFLKMTYRGQIIKLYVEDGFYLIYIAGICYGRFYVHINTVSFLVNVKGIIQSQSIDLRECEIIK